MSGKHGKNDKQNDVPKTLLMQISRWHLWLFRIIALTIIPALLFLLVELTLRIVGYGFPATAIIKCELDGRDVYCVNLATILFNQGKIVEAEQTIRQGKIYAPQSLDLNYYLGIMFERQGRTREAIEEFRTILQRDPNSTKARNKLNALLKKANEI